MQTTGNYTQKEKRKLNYEIPAKGIYNHRPPQEKMEGNVRPEQALLNPWNYKTKNY
jgi:hypothetical protein